MQYTHNEKSNDITNIPYKELNIGDTGSYTRTLTERDLILFATVSGDCNPVHLDEAFAVTTPFKGRIAHGMWTSSLISAALACVLPGPGGIYTGQDVKFIRPVKIGDVLSVQLEVIEKNIKQKKALIRTNVVNQKNKIVVKGIAEVMPAENKITVSRAKIKLPEVIIEGMI